MPLDTGILPVTVSVSVRYDRTFKSRKQVNDGSKVATANSSARQFVH